MSEQLLPPTPEGCNCDPDYLAICIKHVEEREGALIAELATLREQVRIARERLRHMALYDLSGDGQDAVKLRLLSRQALAAIGTEGK
jgi:hypothetical protein